MNDLIIVVLVAIGIYFMVKRGGCCGGHSDKGETMKNNKSSCCSKEREIND
ncbi:hypothetical protein [Clostridium formicaceticum]|uniref:Uncharacterized protein n=1 Tax=Clostridium formicaceticum TaxID=1497 RepID=A0AAC9WHP5_9CLOT|nr:hypothetical protein [Clostridium formicaceticum]ARE89203.1 hypothetical protein CLFO_36100 [Clostridium formicaceticum]